MNKISLINNHLSNIESFQNNQDYHIPTTFKAIIKKDPRGNQVEIAELLIPDKLQPDEVLIKIQVSVISPYDRLFLAGMYGQKDKQIKPPVGLGFEGSGRIVKIGSNIDIKQLGKKVSFISDVHDPNLMGSWAEYIVKKGGWVVWDETIKYVDVCLCFSNPWAVLDFITFAENNNVKCIIQTAAAGSLGTMLIKLCKEKNIKLINIVKGKRAARLIKELEVDYQVNSQSTKQKEKLQKMISELKPTLLVDAVGGEILTNLIKFMPPCSDIILYGWLSQESTSLTNGIICMQEKTIRYQWAKKYLDLIPKGKTFDAEGFQNLDKDLTNTLTKIQQDFNNGGKIFGIKIACEGGIDDYEKLLESSETYASLGKSIFKFHEKIKFNKLV